MRPSEIDCLQNPGLCTFYAVSSLLVIILAISLLWFPFLQLIFDINIIIAKVVIYFNNEFLGIKNCTLINSFEALLVSQRYLFAITLCCMTYGLYLASGDLLASASTYISTLPNNKYMNSIKGIVLEVIEKLLDWKGRKNYESRNPLVRLEV